MAKTSMSQRKTMGRVMHEYTHGELKSGRSGKAGKVKSRRQAIAIALKEAGASRYESRKENKQNLSKSKEKEATGRTYQQETEGKGRVGARQARKLAGDGRPQRQGPQPAPGLVPPPYLAWRAMSDARRIVNLAEVPLKDSGDGKSFQARVGRVGPTLGLTGLGCTLTVVPAGKRAYPFHRHHVFSELFYILSGSGEVRLDDRTLPVRAGDLIASPAGAEAHQIVNTGKDELRYLAISDMDTVDVIDYPDSEKMGVAAGVKNGDLSTATSRHSVA